jgi:hypothetical protein
MEDEYLARVTEIFGYESKTKATQDLTRKFYRVPFQETPS